MKILQLIQKPQLRGAEIFASQLSNHLLDNGHEVILVSVTKGTAVLPFRGKVIRLDRPLVWRLLDLKGWRQLGKVIRDFKPDIIQANAGDTLKLAVFSKLFLQWKAPIIFRNANKVSDFIDSKPKQYFNRFLVQQVDHVISVSELCRLDFIKTYGIPKEKTTTVSIGIELAESESVFPPDLIPFFSEGKVLIHAASFVPEKNHAGLVRIMKQLVDQGVAVRLIMIGDGRLRQEIQQLINESKLEKHILLAGYRPDVLSIMTRAAALVLPSLIEGLPAVILEAMHNGIPVIAYDVGGISEVVKPGETGWLVKAGDENSFMNAIKEVIERKDLSAILEKAYHQVITEFDNCHLAKQFINCYTKLSPAGGGKGVG